jgi:hypothetical protein
MEEDGFDLNECWRVVCRWVCVEVFGEELYKKTGCEKMQVLILKGNADAETKNNVRVRERERVQR